MIFVGVWSKRGGSVTTEEVESMEAARVIFPGRLLQRLRACTKCGHAECPMCRDWCDVLDDAGACCNGRCTYAEPDPFPMDDHAPRPASRGAS